MQVGDGVLFYHSSCAEPGVAGLARVASGAYPDATQFDPASPYFDPKSTVEAPRWLLVDVALVRKTPLLPLRTLRERPELATMARNNLRNAGIQNAEVRQADGASVAPAEGTYDVIVLSGSVTEVPQSLLALLKVGGRLAAIVGDEPVMRATFVTRTSATNFTTRHPWDCNAPRLQNFPEPSTFSF